MKRNAILCGVREFFTNFRHYFLKRLPALGFFVTHDRCTRIPPFPHGNLKWYATQERYPHLPRGKPRATLSKEGCFFPAVGANEPAHVFDKAEELLLHRTC